MSRPVRGAAAAAAAAVASTSTSSSSSSSPPASGNRSASNNRKRKMPPPPPAASMPPSGVDNSMERKDSELLCPICFELLQEAHMTVCGHTFCSACINKSLQQSLRCPKCNFHLESNKNLFPNFALNELVGKYRRRMASRQAQNDGGDGNLRNSLLDQSDSLTLPDVDFVIRQLVQKREQLQAQSYLAQQMLVRDFLSHLKTQKDNQLYQLQKEAAVIAGDLAKVENNVSTFLSKSVRGGGGNGGANAGSSAEDPYLLDCSIVPNADEGFNVTSDPKSFHPRPMTDLKDRRRRMHSHFDDLTECYFSERSADMYFPQQQEEKQRTEGEDVALQASSDAGLDSFAKCLSRFTRYNSVRPLATLNYTTDIFNSASIVSSIEFDKDNEFFAIAGVTKRIKVYDYNVVLKDMVDIHYPSMEMTCNSKISCVTWNSFQKSSLASSNYEGTVILWDVNTSQKTRVFQEHEKRCWSVDFNIVDTKLLASGSDDARVKLWSTNVGHSVASLEAKANVCCVKFNPTSCYHLAFGSADHCVHYYDLRNTKSPLALYKGHRKAVSYVKFLNSESLVSASTDSQLKLWSVGSGDANCRRSFHGHVNEKNFVGLATDGDYLTCGSENNSLYVYYKGLSKPLFSFRFDVVKTMLDRDRREEEAHEFVSAVCWRQGTNIIVGANSQGSIKLLELV